MSLEKLEVNSSETINFYMLNVFYLKKNVEQLLAGSQGTSLVGARAAGNQFILIEEVTILF